MPDDPLSPAQRLFASAIYAPVALEAKLVTNLPAAILSVRQRLTVARFVGKMAVDRGAAELGNRVAASRPATNDPTRLGDDAGSPPQHETGDDTAAAPPAAVLRPADLALPDYDQLPAAHIVGKLAGLTLDERDAIGSYETIHRGRRTVLGKLAQLADGSDV